MTAAFSSDFPDQNQGLWNAFAAMAAIRGDAPALIFPGLTVSFSQLHDLAGQTAGWLHGQGLEKGCVVALHLPKRVETYALWLACLRQGCPYVFMDPRNPPARNASILARLRPKLLVTSAEADNPYGLTLRAGPSVEGQPWLAGKPHVPDPARVNGLDPAYIMFTSGSTGEPKGAVIPHQGVFSLIRWVRAAIAGPGLKNFANINPLHFDNAVFDLYGGLVSGSALVPVETSELNNPAQWVRRLRDGRANVIFAVPTVFLTLERMKLLKRESLPEASVFVFGGEGFPTATLTQFFDRFQPHARFVNVYGPTETSCICSSLEIDPAALAAAGAGFPALGRMHPGFNHAILDSEGQPVPPGTAGELLIGGANVGLGYYANPEETSRRFVQDPSQGNYRSVWYRTGDLVREDADGLLWFQGRVDNQVKIRGHRIELEEIDLAVEAVTGVKRALTVAITGPDGPELRVAFAADGPILPDDIRQSCAGRLPPYMQPTGFLQVDALPQNANGKADRKAVARMFGDAA